jgi:hypothetical protein
MPLFRISLIELASKIVLSLATCLNRFFWLQQMALTERHVYSKKFQDFAYIIIKHIYIVNVRNAKSKLSSTVTEIVSLTLGLVAFA